MKKIDGDNIVLTRKYEELLIYKVVGKYALIALEFHVLLLCVMARGHAAGESHWN